MKLIFEDAKFQPEMKKRAEVVKKKLEYFLESAWPDAPGFGGAQWWAEKAVELKETLMISRNDLRIRHCQPGT
jgi:hypothetical protein